MSGLEKQLRMDKARRLACLVDAINMGKPAQAERFERAIKTLNRLITIERQMDEAAK